MVDRLKTLADRTNTYMIERPEGLAFRISKHHLCLVFIFVLVFKYFLSFFAHPTLQLLFCDNGAYYDPVN